MSMNDHFNRPIFITTVLLALIGVVMIYSTTHKTPDGATPQYLLQLGWFGIGCVAMGVVAFLPPRALQALTIPAYLLILLLLGAVLTMGTVRGSSRWFRIGTIGIQPSEFAKVIVILVLAQYLERKRRGVNRPSVIITSCALVAIPVALILRQPDLGTSLVFGAILCGMLYWAGLSLLELLLLMSPVVSVLLNIISGFDWMVWTIFMITLFGIIYLSRPPVVVSVALMLIHIGVGLTTEPLWRSLHDYQRQRVETFLNPQADALGAGYQIIQSKIAIGSGGLLGRGLLGGTQTQLAFLPEQQTDFIFSVVGEELGFAGSMLVLGLFFILIVRGIHIAVRVKGRYHGLIAAGCVSVFTFHVITNVGMTTGLLPVVGVPLPFLSYGGSSLLTNMVLSGLLLHVWRRRYEY